MLPLVVVAAVETAVYEKNMKNWLQNIFSSQRGEKGVFLCKAPDDGENFQFSIEPHKI